MASIGRYIQERSGILAVLAAVFAGLYLILLHWNVWAVDFSALYFAGHFFGAGEPTLVYAAPAEVIGSQMPPAWIAAVAEAGYPGAQTYPFIYPPWIAVLMAPIAGIDPQVAMNANLLVNVALSLGSIVLAWRIIGMGVVTLSVWVLISLALLIPGVPLVSAVLLGQTQIFVFFLCLAAFERYIARSFIWAGLLLALATCIKITPAAFALIFLFDRNGRALAAFALSSSAILILSYLSAGAWMHQTYLAHLATISGHIYSSFFAFSFETFLHDLLDAATGTAPIRSENEYIFAKPGWISTLSKLCLLVACGALWWVTRRMARPRRIAVQLLGLALIVPIFAPLGWAHYYLLALHLLPAVPFLIGRRLGATLLVVLGLTLSVPFQSQFFDLALAVYPQIMIMVPIFVATLGILLLRFGSSARPAVGGP